MPKSNDLSKCLAALEQDSTVIAVIELGLTSWLVAGIVPGIERRPLKKLGVDEEALLRLLHRWCEEAKKVEHPIKRIAIAFEAGRDGCWLARWLRKRGIEACVSMSREHRRAKSDRLHFCAGRRLPHPTGSRIGEPRSRIVGIAMSVDFVLR